MESKEADADDWCMRSNVVPLVVSAAHFRPWREAKGFADPRLRGTGQFWELTDSLPKEETTARPSNFLFLWQRNYALAMGPQESKFSGIRTGFK
jgi:hypothetical protein